MKESEDSMKDEGLSSIALNKLHKSIYAMLPYYQNAIILGDSLAESILDFRLLRKKNVFAKRGRCIDMIEGEIIRACALNPHVIFMEYGKNDISHFHGDVASFIEVYKKQINIIRIMLPEVTIYVNSIIPMTPKRMNAIGGLPLFLEFNEKLRLMCNESKTIFIDNTSLMDWSEDVFEYDGIHPKYPYYPKWLKHMADVAGLIKTKEKDAHLHP